MARKIVIDPGHGGADSGAVGYGLKEKDINLDIARKLMGRLDNYADVQLTRNSDAFMTLSERAEIANRSKPDLFLSIHVNAGGGTGFESYVYPNALQETLRIRKAVHEQVSRFYKVEGFPDRGMKTANFAVLRETDGPAILLENLFIDRREDTFRLQQPAFREDIAEAIANGVIKGLQLDLEEPPPPPPQQDPNWAAEAFKRMRNAGLVFNDHKLDSNVTWGEFAAVMAKLLDKLNV